jgi:tRNA pseudouridine38-40 synthase
VRTVEEEIEKALFASGLIAKHNYGDLGKIAWSRATRTDKRVHALENCFSCKI